MPLRCLLLGFLYVLLTAPGSAGASAVRDHAETPQVSARLLSSADAVRPGDTIQLGLEQRIIPHWHTYWRNPGDSGVATTIAWTLPPGAVVDDLRWPTPRRFQMGPVVNYGYDNQVVLLSALHIPAAARPGQGVTLKARVEWLVCREECLPQQVDLQLRLPVVHEVPALGRNAEILAAAEARLPVPAPWPVRLRREQEGLVLHPAAPELRRPGVFSIEFFPEQWGAIQQSAVQALRQDDDGIHLVVPEGDVPLAAAGSLRGVLVVGENTTEGEVRRGYQVLAPLKGEDVGVEGGGLALALLFAFLGGATLNLMPCVFPVLSIKALSLVRHAQGDRHQILRQGLAYATGVIVSFVLLALVLLLLKTGGESVGWGFQFQSPLFVLAMACLMFAVGLSLSGAFHIDGGLSRLGEGLAERPGYAGSFFTGVLATVVATPCTAPFMGAAIGFALTRPPVELLLVFVSLGLGLSSPYLALCAWPGLQKNLPRPGRWMEIFKQALAFPMYAAAAWLVWVLSQQSGSGGVLAASVGIVGIAFAAWIYRISRSGGSGQRWGNLAVTLTLLGLLFGTSGLIQNASPVAAPQHSSSERGSDQTAWQAYSADRLQSLRNQGKPVFLNFTAAWCISCIVNEKLALGDESVKAAFAQKGITYLKGDWTHQDAAITAKLAEFGRRGVPLYVYYPADAGAKPVVLPQLLTPGIIVNALN